MLYVVFGLKKKKFSSEKKVPKKVFDIVYKTSMAIDSQHYETAL